MLSEITNPFSYFTDRKGDALDEGYVYVGEPDKDPELFPVAVFWDEALTIPAAQPLRTEAGYIVNPDAGNSPASVYFSGSVYSIRVSDRKGVQVFYDPEAGEIDSSGNFVLPEGDGVTDQSAEIQEIIDEASALSATRGTMVVVKAQGLHALAAGIVVKTGVWLQGDDGGFKAIAAMDSDSPLISVQSGAWFTDCQTIDANGLANFAVEVNDASNFKLLRLHIENWKYGWIVGNSTRDDNDIETSDGEVGWVTCGTAAPSPVYAGWIRNRDSKHVWRISIHDIDVTGPSEDYPTGTADQYEFQGLRESQVWNIGTKGGGELGIAFSRYSRDNNIRNVLAKGNDGDGIQLGSAYCELTLDDVTGLARFDLLFQGDVSGVIDYVWTAQNKVYVGAVSGIFAAGASEQGIELTVDDGRPFEDGQTLTGQTSGAVGIVQRILGLNSSTATDRVYVSSNGSDDTDFVVGEVVSNGTDTATITDIRRGTAPASTVSPTVEDVQRSQNNVLINGWGIENGNDFDNKYLVMATQPVLWNRGDTITGQTSGATAVVWNKDSINITIEDIVGEFQPGETITNGTDGYVLAYTKGYFAGVKVLHSERPTLIACGGYDMRANATQKFGLYISECTDILDAPGNRWTNNVIGERSLNGFRSFIPSLSGDTAVGGTFALDRGTNLWVDGGEITPTAAYHHISGDISTQPTQSAATITKINGTYDGQILILGVGTDGNTLTITNDVIGDENIYSPTGDIVLWKNADRVVLQYQASNDRWSVLSAPTSSSKTIITESGTAANLRALNVNTYQRWTNASDKTLTVQPDATEALPPNGEWHIRNVGAGDLTIVAGSGVTIYGPNGGSLLVPQGGTVTLKRAAADVFDLIGQTEPA